MISRLNVRPVYACYWRWLDEPESNERGCGKPTTNEPSRTMSLLKTPGQTYGLECEGFICDECRETLAALPSMLRGDRI